MRRLFANKKFLTGLCALIFLVAGVERFLEIRYIQALRGDQGDQLASRLGSIRYQLESVLSNNLSLINGLSAFITSNPDFTEDQFNFYASAILDREPALINLAAAPDLVVRYIYPLAGNEAALGLDYTQNEGQRAAVFRAVNTGSMILAGPVNLVQGGQAFIGRAPVFVSGENGQNAVWGIVSAPILTATVFQTAGLAQFAADMEIAIRGRDGLGPSGGLFYGEEEVFSSPLAIMMPVIVGGGSWQMAAVPVQDIAVNHPGILLLRAGSVGAGLILMMAVAIMFLQSEKARAYERIIFRNERFLREVEAVSQVGGWRFSENQEFTELSEQACTIANLPPGTKSASLDRFCQFFDDSSSALLKQAFLKALNSKKRFDTEIKLCKQTGETLWLHLKGDLLESSSESRSLELIGAIQDVTQAKEADRLIEYQASYDNLTGLPNRILFCDRLETALHNARRKSIKLAVFFIDLDNFKSVNDNLGHDAGDDLLIEASKRIKSRLRNSDTVARYSGDEFIVILGDVFSSSSVVSVAADIVHQMGRPFTIGGSQIYCGASIGVSFYPDDGDDVETLIIKADQAMYEVKKAGRNGWQFYTEQMQIESEQRHRLYNELVEAINNNELMVYYQPIVCARTRQVVCCEALVRWCKSSGEWVSPSEFIPVAEERGVVNRIDSFVLRRAMGAVARMNQINGCNMGLSVNVSPRLLYLRDDAAKEWLENVKTRENINITVEITENVLVEGTARVQKVLDDLNEAGIAIAIDDFGTGYSGLSYFSQFPVSMLKIDRSFINKVETSSIEASLVESILHLASKLKVEVVAEGVETQAQADLLDKLDCDFLQGYLISPPLPEDEFMAYLEQDGR